MKLASATTFSAVLVICLSSISCGQKENRATQAGSKSLPAQPTRLEVTTVKSQKLNTTERLPAEIVPYESVDIYAKETGFVKSIKVDRGSKVKQGELIAELEAPAGSSRRCLPKRRSAARSRSGQAGGRPSDLSAYERCSENPWRCGCQ